MIFYLLNILFILILSMQVLGAGTSFSLIQTDHTGIARVNEPVTIGVPLPKGYLHADRGSSPLFTVDNSPAQTEVLSTWPDNTAKWVLLNYLTNLSGNASQPVAVAAGGASPNGNVSITWDGTKAFITTGALSFEINRGDNFNMLSNITVGGQVHVGADAGNGLFLKDKTSTAYKAVADQVTVESAGPIRGLVLIEGRFKNGASYLTPNNPTAVSTISSPEVLHVRFKMRIYVFTDNPSVKIDLILHNPGAHNLQANEVEDGWCRCQSATVTDLFTNSDGSRETRFYTMQDVKRWESGIDWEQYRQWLDVDDYYISFGLQGASSVTAAADNGSAVPVAPGQTFRTLQYTTLTNPSASGGTQTEHYQVLNNGSPIHTGTRGSGWIEVVNSNKRIVVAQKRFWERAPHSHEYADGRIKLGLLPGNLPSGALKGGATGYLQMSQPAINSHHRVTGGKWIGKTLFLEFSNTASNPQTAADFAKIKQRPLMPVPEADQLHKSNALDGYYPDTYEDDASGFLHTALMRRAKLRRSFFDASALEQIPNKTSPTLRQVWDSNPAWNYGWRYAGDITWSGNWPSATHSNLHYDWPYGMTMDFLRAPHQELWDMVDLMVCMRTEIGQYHHREGMMWADGGGWYEKCDHYIEPDRPRRTHNWNGGVSLYYFLTGDRFVRDAAVELGDFFYWTESWNPYAGNPQLTWWDTTTQAVDTSDNDMGTRGKTWPILGLVNTYELTGEEKYLKMAVYIYRYYVLDLETNRGTQPQDGLAGAANGLQIGYAGYPLVRLYEALKQRDGRLLGTWDPEEMAGLIENSLKAMHDHATSMRTGGFKGGTVVTVPEYQGPYGMTGAYCQFYSAIAGCLYKHNIQGMHNAATREIIEENLSYFVKYYGGDIDWSKTDYSDRSNYSATAFGSNSFSGTETKQFGWDGLFNPYAIRSLYMDEDAIMMDAEGLVPAGDRLAIDVHPNPFNPVTKIAVSCQSRPGGTVSNFSLRIFDINGKMIKDLTSNFYNQQSSILNQITWNAALYPSGLYIVKLAIGNKILTRKITLLK